MKLFIKIFFVILLVYCNAPAALADGEQKIKKIAISLDMKKEEQLQKEVDKGHQPWRLDPVDVAHAAVLSVDNRVSYKNCQVTSESNREAIVKCKSYIIKLKQLIRARGIWTATEIQVDN